MVTFKSNQRAQLHDMLGIMSHGSRAILQLAAVISKRAWGILGYLSWLLVSMASLKSCVPIMKSSLTVLYCVLYYGWRGSGIRK